VIPSYTATALVDDAVDDERLEIGDDRLSSEMTVGGDDEGVVVAVTEVDDRVVSSPHTMNSVTCRSSSPMAYCYIYSMP
jgi:hypothetical protein